jgi:hypothetical protein
MATNQTFFFLLSTLLAPAAQASLKVEVVSCTDACLRQSLELSADGTVRDGVTDREIGRHRGGGERKRVELADGSWLDGTGGSDGCFAGESADGSGTRGQFTVCPDHVDTALMLVGPDRRVNIATEGAQHHATLAWGAHKAVSAYNNGSSEGRISVRFHDGLEVDLTTEDSLASHPQVRVVSERVFVAYQDVTGVWLAELEADGWSPGASLVAENDGMTHPEYIDIAPAAHDGAFLAVWNRFEGDPEGTLEARMVYADGTMGDIAALGTPERVGGTVTALGLGEDHLVAWAESGDKGSTLRVQRVRDGRPLGEPVVVAHGSRHTYVRPKLASLDGGKVALVFGERDLATGLGMGASMLMLDASLNPVSAAVRLDGATHASRPEIESCSHDFVATWDEVVDGSEEVRVQLFTAEGEPLTLPRTVNHVSDDDQKRPDIQVRCEGGHVAEGQITWESNQQDGDDRGIYTRTFLVD